MEYKIVSLVDRIFKIKNKNSNADVSEIEREIDGMVYGLYGLSEGKVRIVENNN